MSFTNDANGVPRRDAWDPAGKGDAAVALENRAIALSNHIAATAAHGATGAVVGTTNAQTLTNKTISGGSNTITNLSASNLTSGTVADARLSSNVPLKNASSNVFAVGVSEWSFNQGSFNGTPTLYVRNTAGKAGALAAGTGGAVFCYDASGVFAILAEAAADFTGNNLGGGTAHFLINSAGRTLIGVTLPTDNTISALQVGGDFVATSTVGCGVFTTGTLPTPGLAGRMAFVTDGGFDVGGSQPVWDSGSAWKYANGSVV
jgi:hypothetical protein